MKGRNFITACTCLMLAIFVFTACGSKDSEYGPEGKANGTAVIENIMTRASVRQYTGKAVPEDTVKIMLKAAMAAPSAVDKRPWTFVVLKEQAKRDKIGAAISGVGDKTKTAGAVILVCGNKERFLETQPEYWVQDCSAATENLLLAAHALKLGAVWCGVYPDEGRVKDVQDILGLPENIIPLNVVTIGYPTALQNPKDKWDESNIITI